MRRGSIFAFHQQAGLRVWYIMQLHPSLRLWSLRREEVLLANAYRTGGARLVVRSKDNLSNNNNLVANFQHNSFHLRLY